MTFPVSRPIPQTQRDFRFEHRTAGHRKKTIWEDLMVLSAYDVFHSLTFYGEVSGLGTKCIVVRGLWNVVLHTMCDRAVLPKELDKKDAKLRFQSIITACLSFSAECGGTPAGGESVVHKLMDAMSLFCGVPG